MDSSTPTKIGLVSCGLGHVNRGFEVSTARWYAALKEQPGLDVQLYCGGQYPGGQSIWNINRDILLTGFLSYLPLFADRQRWEFSYIVEQLSFAFSLLPELCRSRPQVLWTKEVPLAHFLDLFRR